MKPSEKLLKAAVMLHDAEKLYDEAVQEVIDKTGREYVGHDNAFGMHMLDAKDCLAFFIGEAMITADNK